MIATDELEVSEGVRMLSLRTPTLPPATHTNAFLVGTREAVLVEPASPYPEEIERVVQWVRDAEAQGIRLRALLLTHHHPDHAGGAAALSERLSLPLWAHPRTAERLSGLVQIDRMLEGGECLTLDGKTPVEVDVVHTPGHAPGHLCFLVRQGSVLIAGDMVAGTGTILIEPVDGDMQQYLASLAALDALDTRVILPAHGGPIDDPRPKLAFYIQHRLAREQKVLTALRELSGPDGISPTELVPRAYADTPRAAWGLAAGAAEAHLIKLEREGHAERTSRGFRAL